MIVICGSLARRPEDGLSVLRVARTAAESGAAVQVVGVVPDDPEGDRLLMGMSAEQVGHVAVLRGPARELEAADVDVALRYLPDVRVIVVAGLSSVVIATAAASAAWSGAALVVLERRPFRGTELPTSSLDAAMIVEAPKRDPDGAFAGFVGSLIARLDAGSTAADAWAATTRELSVDVIRE